MKTKLKWFAAPSIEEKNFVELLKKPENKVINFLPDSSPKITIDDIYPSQWQDPKIGDLTRISLYDDFFIVYVHEGLKSFFNVRYAILYENISNVNLSKGEGDELTKTKITLSLKKKTQKKQQMKYYVRIQYKNQLSENFGVCNIGVAESFCDTLKGKIAQEKKDDIIFIRLNKLKKLYDASLISEEEYNKRKEEILTEI